MHPSRLRREMSRAFTLTELVVTLSIIAALAGLAMAWRSKSGGGAARVECLDNLRALQAGWQRFATDHGGALPSCEGEFAKGDWRTLDGGWVTGSAASDADEETITEGTLFPHVGNKKYYRCPADKSLVNRTTKLRLRSYSMNVYLGALWQGTEPKRLISEIQSPARTFVFIEESESTINDGAFAPEPPPILAWNDLPADRHDGRGSLSFADGHAEDWKWSWPKTGTGPRFPANDADANDAARLRDALGF